MIIEEWDHQFLYKMNFGTSGTSFLYPGKPVSLTVTLLHGSSRLGPNQGFKVQA